MCIEYDKLKFGASAKIFKKMTSNDVIDFSETINNILKINNSVRSKLLSKGDPVKRKISSLQSCDFEKKINNISKMINYETIDLTCDDKEPERSMMEPSITSSHKTNVLQPMLSIHNDHQYECNNNQYLENCNRSHEGDHEGYSINLEPEVILRVEGESLSNSTLPNKNNQQFPKSNTTIHNNNNILNYKLKSKLCQKKLKSTNLTNRNGLKSINKTKYIIRKTGIPVRNNTVNNIPNYSNCIIQKTGKKTESIENSSKSAPKDNIEVIDLSSDEDDRSCSESAINSENDWKKDSEFEYTSEAVNINNTNVQSGRKECVSLSIKVKTDWMLNSCTQYSYDKLLSNQKLPDNNFFDWVIYKKLFNLKSSSHMPKYSILKNSIFDVSKPPKVVLELISHWILQSDTNVVMKKLNLSETFLKGFYQCLRTICTLSLSYKRFASNKNIVELGVTTLQIHLRNDIKHLINMFGAYNSSKKQVRYFLLPKNDKKSIRNVIEAWIEKSCIIFCDEKINMTSLKEAGYNVFSEKNNVSKNVHIKNSLERKLLSIFQGKIHHMNSSLVQQFLDELAWRDEFGKSYDELLKSMLDCIQFQTKKCANKNFLEFLNYVAKSPQEFLIQPNYLIQEKPTPKSKEDDRNSYMVLRSSLSTTTTSTTSSTSVTSVTTTTSSISTTSVTSINHDRQNIEQRKLQTVKQILLKEKAYQPIQTRSVTLNSFENCKSMERIYFGYKFGRSHESFSKTTQRFICTKCKKVFSNNIEFLDHLNGSVFNSHDVNQTIMCRYCLRQFSETSDLKHHIDTQHPLAIVNFEENTFSCPICEMTYSTMQDIRAHLNEIHPPYDLPYNCHVCSFLCYSHRLAVDHFYLEHKGLCLIQCPLCLHCVSFHKDNGPYYSNETQSYINHIKSHIKQKQFKCKKCVLTFCSKDKYKKHLECGHKQNENDVVQFNNFQNYVIQNLLCSECHGSLFLNAGHLKIMSTCEKCDYTTYCRKAFATHTCTENNYSLELNREMICICGFKSIDGFELAKHLVNCKHKTVYGSVSEAEFMKSSGSLLITLGLEKIK